MYPKSSDIPAGLGLGATKWPLCIVSDPQETLETSPVIRQCLPISKWQWGGRPPITLYIFPELLELNQPFFSSCFSYLLSKCRKKIIGERGRKLRCLKRMTMRSPCQPAILQIYSDTRPVRKESSKKRNSYPEILGLCLVKFGPLFIQTITKLKSVGLTPDIRDA